MSLPIRNKEEVLRVTLENDLTPQEARELIQREPQMRISLPKNASREQWRRLHEMSREEAPEMDKSLDTKVMQQNETSNSNNQIDKHNSTSLRTFIAKMWVMKNQEQIKRQKEQN